MSFKCKKCKEEISEFTDVDAVLVAFDQVDILMNCPHCENTYNLLVDASKLIEADWEDGE